MKKLLLTACAMLAAAPATAQIAVSVNDGKQLRPGEAASARTADSVSIIDMNQYPPRVVGTVQTETSMIGPPTSVAVARHGRLALVTAAQTLDGDTIVKGDVLSVIDISKPSAPRLVQKLESAAGATGVAINPAGTLALVVGTGDDAVWVYSIAGNRLTQVGKVKLDYQSRPTDVAFAPDGKTAYAVLQSAGKIVRLDVDGTKVTRSSQAIVPGVSPYGVTVGRDGRYAFNTNLGGAPGAATRTPGNPVIGSVGVLDLANGTLAASIDVGVIPEHVALSPDGKYLAVVVANGSGSPVGSPGYNPFGLLQIYSINGATLNRVAEARTGSWCQGAAWRNDNTAILLQCALTKAIEVYRFDGTNLVNDAAATLSFNGRPGAISTATDR